MRGSFCVSSTKHLLFLRPLVRVRSCGWGLQKRQEAADTRETVLSGLRLTGETLGNGIAEFLGNRQVKRHKTAD